MSAGYIHNLRTLRPSYALELREQTTASAAAVKFSVEVWLCAEGWPDGGEEAMYPPRAQFRNFRRIRGVTRKGHGSM